MPEEEHKKQKPVAAKFTGLVATFLGSWWAVVFHTLWFGFWLVFDFNIDNLTLWVSLEAIFIGIFLLMAANRAEVERDRRETEERSRQRKMIGLDISMDRKQVSDIEEIKNSITRLEKQIAHLTKVNLDKKA